MPIATVRQLCRPSDAITSDSLVEQVAQIEEFASGAIDGRAFFKRNHFTAGLERLVRLGFDRLAGRGEDGAFYLTQAMGGGKTHSLIAFGLLAADPELRREVVPKLASGKDFGSAKVVIFNGHQNPDTLLWGYIADRLGRGEVMTPFWKNGAKVPGVDQWAAVLGDEPVLILLDELPSYLQMAQGEPVGATTLGDLTIGALERLFNALPQCGRACVVVTNLKDDVYLDGSGLLRTLIDNLSSSGAGRGTTPCSRRRRAARPVAVLVVLDRVVPRRRQQGGRDYRPPMRATVRATFDGSDPRTGPPVTGEIDAPPGATRLRAVAEVNGQFSAEETSPLVSIEADDKRTPLNPDLPVVMTSRFETKGTAATYAALDRLTKIQPAVRILGCSVEMNGQRSEKDYVALRLGRDVPLAAADLDQLVKKLADLLAAEAPVVMLRLDSIEFPLGRDLTAFSDGSGEDFSRVEWKQD